MHGWTTPSHVRELKASRIPMYFYSKLIFLNIASLAFVLISSIVRERDAPAALESCLCHGIIATAISCSHTRERFNGLAFLAVRK